MSQGLGPKKHDEISEIDRINVTNTIKLLLVVLFMLLPNTTLVLVIVKQIVLVKVLVSSGVALGNKKVYALKFGVRNPLRMSTARESRAQTG